MLHPSDKNVVLHVINYVRFAKALRPYSIMTPISYVPAEFLKCGTKILKTLIKVLYKPCTVLLN